MTEQARPVVSRGLWWTGAILTGLTGLLIIGVSGLPKFLKPEGMEANVTPLGWRMDQMTTLGIVEVACGILYLIPQTSVFGAVLLTAYLGGATATHARIGDPFYFPIIIGIVMWLGIYLREPRLWPLSPIRK